MPAALTGLYLMHPNKGSKGAERLQKVITGTFRHNLSGIKEVFENQERAVSPVHPNSAPAI